MEINFKLNHFNETILIEIGIKPKFYAYVLLFVTLVLLIIPFLFPIFHTIERIILIFIYLIAVILFPIKYAIWNVFGKAILILNKKSISHQYNFGFISNNLNSAPYSDGLTISFEDLLIDKEEKFGKIYFYEDDEITGLPKLIHNRSIRISEDTYELIVQEFQNLCLFTTFSED